MRIKSSSWDQGEEPVNVMPLIDVVFFLLVFFLIASTFAKEEREADLKLPGTAAIAPLSAEPKQVIVNVKEDGTAIVGGRAYDAAALLEFLANAVKNQPDREVLIRADERGLVKHLAGVVSICRQAGVNQFKIGYLAEPPKS
jgi:biopolymer transport protein ExbD